MQFSHSFFFPLNDIMIVSDSPVTIIIDWKYIINGKL